MSFSKLDSHRIVIEALQLLAEEGLAQVGVRRLAQRLGVSASSLYWHVADRGALLGLMSAHVFAACVARVPSVTDWQAWLRAFGLEVWDTQHRLRDASLLILTATVDAKGRSSSRKQLEDRLANLGCPDPLARPALTAVQSLATGWTTMQSLESGADPDARSHFTLALDALLDGLAGRAGQPL